MVYDALEMTYRTVKIRRDPAGEPITGLIDYDAFCGSISDDAAAAGCGHTISARDLKNKMDDRDDFLLVDVREQNEYEIVVIPGSVLIPKGDILSGEALSSLPMDKPTILHCKSGARSAEAWRSCTRPASPMPCMSVAACWPGSSRSIRACRPTDPPVGSDARWIRRSRCAPHRSTVATSAVASQGDPWTSGTAAGPVGTSASSAHGSHSAVARQHRVRRPSMCCVPSAAPPHGRRSCSSGGQGRTWRCGNTVIKPVSDPAEASWLANTFEQLQVAGVRLARPVRSSDGRWVVAGWSAQRFVSGSPAPRHDEILQAAQRCTRRSRRCRSPGFCATGRICTAGRIGCPGVSRR